MKNEINVIYTTEPSEYEKIKTLYYDPKINKTFNGCRIDRLVASEISFLIYHRNEPIGFILLVREKIRPNSLGIDIALKEEYRGKGYGKLAMEIFKTKYLKLIEENLYAEINTNNIAAQKTIKVLDTEYTNTVNNSEFYNIINNKRK